MSNDTEQIGPTPAETTAPRWCVRCGSETQTTWEFCGSCGHRIPDADGESTLEPTRALEHDHTPEDVAEGIVLLAEPVSTLPAVAPAAPVRVRQRRSPMKLTLATLGALLVLALVAGAGYLYQQTRNDLRSTRADLAATQTELESTSATLTETEESLADTESQLTDTTTQLTRVRARLRTAQQELAGVNGTLENAQDRLDLQANQIETLKICLDGVTSAMSYAAYDDYGAAIASLDAVEVSCNSAYELF